jgi:hypothetical protein
MAVQTESSTTTVNFPPISPSQMIQLASHLTISLIQKFNATKPIHPPPPPGENYHKLSPPKSIIQKLSRSSILTASSEQSNRLIRHLVHKYKRLLKKVANLEEGKKQVCSKVFRIVRQSRQQRHFRRHNLRRKAALEEKGGRGRKLFCGVCR